MWNFQFEWIPASFTVSTWIVILVIAHFLYIKQEIHPKRWKVIFVTFVGVFCFSISWNMSGNVLRFPVLPLGVWIVYGVLRTKEGRWAVYRRFAWLGFWANFLFLVSNLLSAQSQSLVYPLDEPSIYLADVEEASIVSTHPSANKVTLKEERLKDRSNLQEAQVHSVEWYEEGENWEEPKRRNERFPYLLIDAEPKWGSGADSRIYIERDGKGILISTSQKQYYFRAEQSVLAGELDE